MQLPTPYNIPFVRVFLRIYFTYGESKRAGNGWRVCRTCNFSFARKIAGARAYWGRHIEKGERKTLLFLCGFLIRNSYTIILAYSSSFLNATCHSFTILSNSLF